MAAEAPPRASGPAPEDEVTPAPPVSDPEKRALGGGGDDAGLDDGHDKARLRMIDFAKTATEKEHKMTLWQGIRLYPKAIAWSVLISTCIVMEGYDVCLINNFCKFFGRGGK